MDGRIEGQTNRHTDRRTEEKNSRPKDGQTDRRTDEKNSRLKDGRTDGRSDEHMERHKTEEQKDRNIE
jgi:hypothetical protein